MPTRVFLTHEFSKFTRKERIPDALFVEAVERTEAGLIDADLGGGLVKLRVARLNEGRSGGYRTIVAYVRNERAFFLYGYAKNDLDNVGRLAEKRFRQNADGFQRLSDLALESLIRERALREIERR